MITILTILTTYLFIGAVISSLFAGILNHMEDVEQFNNRERLAVILMWPVAVATFIVGFIKERMSGGNKK